MKVRSHIHKFAAQLVKISHTNDLVDEGKVAAILKVLPKNSETLAILKEYYRLISQAILKEQLVISAGHELSNEQIQALVNHFEQKFENKFTVTFVQDPGLIAGVNVQAGDKIFEKSIRASLLALKKHK